MQKTAGKCFPGYQPEDWHNEQEKARQLTPYKPATRMEYLKKVCCGWGSQNTIWPSGQKTVLLRGHSGDETAEEEAALYGGSDGLLRPLSAFVESEGKRL